MDAAVTVALIDANKDVLLVKDLDHTDPQLKFPGGHVKPGEFFKDAGARETEEESGVRIPTHLLEVLHAEFRPSKFKEEHHAHLLLGAMLPGTFEEYGLQSLGSSGEETHVVPLRELSATLEFEPHRELLKKVKEQLAHT